MKGKVYYGDCIERMKKLKANSVDAIVTDPPYGLGFMNKAWDSFTIIEFFKFCLDWGREALRVLKHGAYLVAFCGTKNYDIMVFALRLAGFEIRDQLDWLYGQGFAKGTDISKAIDKHFGIYKKRKKIGEYNLKRGSPMFKGRTDGFNKEGYSSKVDITIPACKQSLEWEGWRTNLAPAHEPIVLAMKPREGKFAENVLNYGVGGLNIEACRIPYQNEQDKKNSCTPRPNDAKHKKDRSVFTSMDNTSKTERGNPNGRYPSNVLIHDDIAPLLDEQFRIYKEGKRKHNRDVNRKGLTDSSNVFRLENCGFKPESNNSSFASIGDVGGVSKYFKRFFYCPKADKIERNLGLESLPDVTVTDGREKTADNPYQRGKTKRKNPIETLKPINLMRWLVLLVCPKNGIVLDPFAGAGTTGIACEIEHRKYILIEKRDLFAKKIIPLRLKFWSNKQNWEYLNKHSELKNKEIEAKVKGLDSF